MGFCSMLPARSQPFLNKVSSIDRLKRLSIVALKLAIAEKYMNYSNSQVVTVIYKAVLFVYLILFIIHQYINIQFLKQIN